MDNEQRRQLCVVPAVWGCLDCPFGIDEDPYPIACRHPFNDSGIADDKHCPLLVASLLIRREMVSPVHDLEHQPPDDTEHAGDE